MASLKQAAKVSDQVTELAAQLHAEVADGRADFGELARLADDIGESADALAAAFFAIDEALTQQPADSRPEVGARNKGRRRGAARAAKRGKQRSEKVEFADQPPNAEPHDPTKGGSAPPMPSNQEPEQPLEERSAEELLERARALEIAGRSTMSKEELAEAVRSEESVSKEELLDRARDADIPGRSTMSKEELREALGSQ